MVVDDPEEAARLLAAGESVVLAGENPPRALEPGPGRLALFCGSLGDPGAWEAATAMDRELFGAGG